MAKVLHALRRLAGKVRADASSVEDYCSVVKGGRKKENGRVSLRVVHSGRGDGDID